MAGVLGTAKGSSGALTNLFNGTQSTGIMGSGVSKSPFGRGRYTDPTTSKVYLGTSTPRPGSKLLKPGSVPTNSGVNSPRSPDLEDSGEQWVDADGAIAKFYQMTDKERQEWGEYALENGLISTNTFSEQLQAWTATVQEAAQFSAAGKKIPLRQVARLIGSKNGAGSSASFTGSRTNVSKNASVTNENAVQLALEDVFQESFGRNPTDSELKAFTASLNEAQKNNPVVSTTTSNYKDGVETDSTRVDTGGVDASANLVNQARNRPEYGAYQAATTYHNALIDAIKAPV